jgi:hypothetical protein
MCMGYPAPPVRTGARVVVGGVTTTVLEVRSADREFWVELDGRRAPLYFHQQGVLWRPAGA